MSLAQTARWRSGLAALALLISVAHPVAAETTSTKGSITRVDTLKPMSATKPRDLKSCATAYHASLKRIETGAFARLKAAGAGTGTFAGDPRLPGALLLPPKPASRSKPEMAALAAANTAAKSKGRVGSASDPDSVWLAGRLKVDLGDYLGQGPSPFLCGGVPAYVDTLRRFAERIGSSPDRRADLRMTQVDATRRSIETALLAMKPVTPPHFAPADRPDLLAADMPTGGIAGLRPAAGVSRGEDMGPTMPSSSVTSSDPDLPPLKRAEPIALTTVSDLAAAADLLTETARANGFATVPANQMAIGNHAGLSPLGFPVLSRIAKAREYVIGERPLIEDRSARQALAAALSDIEALDYLMRAEKQEGDPVGKAIHATLDEILAAHRSDCTCKN